MKHHVFSWVIWSTPSLRSSYHSVSVLTAYLLKARGEAIFFLGSLGLIIIEVLSLTSSFNSPTLLYLQSHCAQVGLRFKSSLQPNLSTHIAMSGRFWADIAETTGVRVTVPVNGGRWPGLYLIPEYTVLPPLRSSLNADTDEDEKEDEAHSAPKPVLSPQKHEYRRLKPDELRLLVLNPGLPEELINCSLERHSVNRAKRYIALSYVWGDPKDSFSIQVDGRPFKVTENLRDFLAAYRTNTTCPVLWIDAVCIDQNNIPERNAQIQLMKRIYEGAESVVIWLGPELDNTKAAIREIESIYDVFWLPRLRRQRAAQRAILSITATDVPEILGNVERASHEEAWAGIEDLLQRPW